MAVTQAIDFYRVLQVDPDAEPEVIAAAYRKLAAKYHPDVNPSAAATERMKEINQAYGVLSDPDQRAAYDRARGERWRASSQTKAAAAPPPGSVIQQLARTVAIMALWSVGVGVVANMFGGRNGMALALILILALVLWRGPQLMKFFGRR